MKIKTRIQELILLVTLLFFGLSSFAQLPAFALSVTATPQTCLGNGSLLFMTNGTQPGATVGYQVYLLPNTTMPVATVNTAMVTNLVAGNYLIIATQTVGNLSGTATATASIDNQVVPLLYSLSVKNARCGGDGEITVNVTSGVPVSYEILSGPVIVPPQTSNVFTGLPAGAYTIRVYNNCGNAFVLGTSISQPHTNIDMLPVSANSPTIGSTCNTAFVANIFDMVAGSDTIFWPLTFEYTVYPPGGGAPVIVVNVMTDPPGGGLVVNTEIPFFYDQDYSYDLTLTDACGNVFTENNNQLHGVIDWGADIGYDPCLPESITIGLKGLITLPATINFISAPAGFNPQDFSASHPVFNTDQAVYANQGSTLPIGSYFIQITDVCGRSLTKEVLLQPNTLIDVSQYDSNCVTGTMKIDMLGKEAVVVEFIAAPAAYGFPVPHDLSGFGTTQFLVPDLPPGTYTVHIIDECGFENTVQLPITVNPDTGLSVFQLPGCAPGEGSIRISAGQNHIVSVIIESAPPAFSETLPFDASANIDQINLFNMGSLPAGQYTFNVSTECGPQPMDVLLKGYTVLKNDFEVIPNCGFFNLDIKHSSNAGNLQNFWLQRYNEAEGMWEHPLTGNNYTEGTPLGLSYAIALTNNTLNTGFGFTGTFRVIKVFYTYTDGLVQLTRCADVVKEFEFDGEPQILSAYSFPCDNGTADIVIDAIGAPPLNYRITTKDGIAFVVDNGNSPLFTGLDPATYNFEVSDTCGNLRNILYNITTLDPLVILEEGFCTGQDSELYVPDFPFLVYSWWKDGAPATILSTTSKLLFPDFDPVADAGIYYVSITTANPGSCIDIVRMHEVDADGLPDAGDDATVTVCNDGGELNLDQYLTGDFEEGGSWTDTDASGALAGNIVPLSALPPGTYHFGYTVTNGCGFTDLAEITLQLEASPSPVAIEPVAPVCEGEPIQLSVLVDGAVYEWTGPNNFTSNEQNPVIANAGPEAQGIYTLRLIASGSNCFTQPSVIWVGISAVPDFTLVSYAAGCQGQTSSIEIDPVNFNIGEATYKWYLDGILLGETSAQLSVTQAGNYEVVVDNNSCSSSRNEQITLVDPFEVTLDSGCINYDYMLWVANIANIPGAIVTWTGPDNFSFTGPQANITNGAKGEYTATVTNAEGCIADATITIDNASCIIPRGLSPNGDGYNDSFDLSNLDVIELKIFNRYGLKVYEAKEYLKEWHGQSDKGTLPSATYYYVITLSAGKQVTGWVYLQREE